MSLNFLPSSTSTMETWLEILGEKASLEKKKSYFCSLLEDFKCRMKTCLEARNIFFVTTTQLFLQTARHRDTIWTKNDGRMLLFYDSCVSSWVWRFGVTGTIAAFPNPSGFVDQRVGGKGLRVNGGWAQMCACLMLTCELTCCLCKCSYAYVHLLLPWPNSKWATSQ